MKLDNIEICAVLEATEQNDTAIVELNDLQLALIGGGGGEVIFL